MGFSLPSPSKVWNETVRVVDQAGAERSRFEQRVIEEATRDARIKAEEAAEAERLRKEQEAEANRLAMEARGRQNKRDNFEYLHNQRADVESRANELVGSEISKEKSRAKLIGVDYTGEADQGQRTSDKFAELWTQDREDLYDEAKLATEWRPDNFAEGLARVDATGPKEREGAKIRGLSESYGSPIKRKSILTGEDRESSILGD